MKLIDLNNVPESVKDDVKNFIKDTVDAYFDNSKNNKECTCNGNNCDDCNCENNELTPVRVSDICDNILAIDNNAYLNDLANTNFGEPDNSEEDNMTLHELLVESGAPTKTLRLEEYPMPINKSIDMCSSITGKLIDSVVKYAWAEGYKQGYCSSQVIEAIKR